MAPPFFFFRCREGRKLRTRGRRRKKWMWHYNLLDSLPSLILLTRYCTFIFFFFKERRKKKKNFPTHPHSMYVYACEYSSERWFVNIFFFFFVIKKTNNTTSSLSCCHLTPLLISDFTQYFSVSHSQTRAGEKIKGQYFDFTIWVGGGWLYLYQNEFVWCFFLNKKIFNQTFFIKNRKI